MEYDEELSPFFSALAVSNSSFSSYLEHFWRISAEDRWRYLSLSSPLSAEFHLCHRLYFPRYSHTCVACSSLWVFFKGSVMPLFSADADSPVSASKLKGCLDWRMLLMRPCCHLDRMFLISLRSRSRKERAHLYPCTITPTLSHPRTDSNMSISKFIFVQLPAIDEWTSLLLGMLRPTPRRLGGTMWGSLRVLGGR